jgi:penicillin-binding protein 2
MGVDAIHDFIAQFGFGARTGIDIEGEQPGLLPSTAWKMKRYRQKWFAGDTISVGIGQGYNLATPIQLAHATAALANGGTVHPPRLVKAIQDSRSGELRPNLPKPANTIDLKPDHLQRVKAALVDVTRPGGTAARAGANAPYVFAGKTGTAQVVGMKQGEKYDEKKLAERYRDHALFIAYAPADKPTIAVAVMVENGGHGGSTAAPIARQVFDYYLTGKLPEQLEAGAEVEEEHD